MMFFMSCRTITKTIYFVPDIDFPEFPELGDYEINDSKVTTDESYFRKLLIFRTQYFNEIEKYNEKKSRLENEENG